MQRFQNNLVLASLLAAAIMLAHCQTQTKGAFTVTVAYNNSDKMPPADSGKAGGNVPGVAASAPARILLEEIPYGGDMNPVILDSGTLVKNNGDIVLKGNGKEEGIYQLAVTNGPMLLLVNDADNIKVNIDLSKRENYYTVTGSEASVQLKDFISAYSEKTFSVNKAFASLDSLKQTGASDSIMIGSTKQKNNALKDLNTYLTSFISGSSHPALSLFALGWSSRSFAQEDFEKSLNEVVGRFPNHEVLKKLHTMYNMQKAQAAGQQQQGASSWVGKPAPALALPDATGKLVSINDFKGKYLLVDFWASWCGPCRQENPNVVKAYDAFKNKNFTILGVSLDKEKDPWLKAVKDDNLAWTHISDLKYWNSQAVDIFHFDGIPFNVLIDPQGTVIAENLRGFDLEKKLQEVLK